MGIFLIGAVGLGFDGSHLYSQRMKAQLAADSAAQAAMMSVYDGTYSTGATAFTVASGGSYTCGSTVANTSTPCVYANKNGFNSASGDTVTLSFPSNPSTAAPGVNFASGFPTELIQVEVDRNVPTTLMRLLGSTATTVKAVGVAAIVSVFSPVPIIVIHPTLTNSFTVQGNPVVQICGGPQRSIQVNSTDPDAFHIAGDGAVDLSAGGPADTKGDCSTPGKGTDLGNWGGPGPGSWVVPGTGGCAKGDVCIGSKGHYLQPASWIPDPLANVDPPTPAPTTVVTAPLTVAAGTYGCPAGTAGGCQLYTPGSYAASIDGKGQYNLFAPGVYYINQTSDTNAFGCTANCTLAMATGLTDNSTTLTSTVTGGYATVTSCCGTKTSWNGSVDTTTGGTGGILVYNSGVGTFNVGSNGSANLVGTLGTSAYKGIIFFENRTAGVDASKIKNPTLKKFTPHQLGGGGTLSLIGTIYLTNTRATMLASPDHFQELDLSGNSGNSTYIQGEIIVDSLQMGGGGTIQMNLNSSDLFVVNQVALVQ
jgi:Flp pilus assembly protein TadG